MENCKKPMLRKSLIKMLMNGIKTEKHFYYLMLYFNFSSSETIICTENRDGNSFYLAFTATKPLYKCT